MRIICLQYQEHNGRMAQPQEGELITLGCMDCTLIREDGEHTTYHHHNTDVMFGDKCCLFVGCTQ